MNDLLYSLVGASPEGDPREEEKTQREDGSWLIDGQYPLIDFLDEFDLEASEEDTRGVTTLGGFVMLKLRHLPRTGEKINGNGLEMEIMDMDGRRIDKVLVRDKRSEEHTAKLPSLRR